MPAASPATVVISCPQCGTRYRLAREALGGGRVVQCAHCQHSWEAVAPDAEPIAMTPLRPVPAPATPAPATDDAMFDPVAEARLDEEFVSAAQAAKEAADAAVPAESIERTIAEIKSAIAPKQGPPESPADVATVSKRLRAFSRRQNSIRRNMPLGRMRRTARIAAVVALLALAAGGFALRTEIVRQFPDLAGVYAAIGLPVNVIGLEFRDVATLQSLVQGVETLTVTGQIASAADRWVVVPPVVVTLLNDAGASIYEWSVTPDARDLEPGEAIKFETRLTQPPEGAVQVRLTFTNGRSQPETVAVEPAPAETHS